jgi:hypothetical protein
VKRLLPILCVLLLAACGGDDATEADDGAPAATTATTVATTSTATAETDTGLLEIVGIYDGEDCSYEGPETASIEDEFGLTFVNDSADAAFLRVLLIPPDRMADIEPLVGTDFDFSGGRTTSLNPTIYGESGPFSESSSLAYLPSPGKYLVECALVEGATPVHVWWLAILEVNP